MQHVVCPSQGTSARCEIGHGTFDELDLIDHSIEVLPLSRREIVENDHIVAFADQQFNDMRSDESCPTGYNELHTNRLRKRVDAQHTC
jgi:hypothetical protein